MAEEHETIGWRHVLSSVNLRDFADMVHGEGIMIGTMLRRAFAALPRLPFGPLIFIAFMVMAWIRTFLLFAVVIFFGGAIVLISVVRGLTRRSGDPPEPTPED